MKHSCKYQYPKKLLKAKNIRTFSLYLLGILLIHTLKAQESNIIVDGKAHFTVPTPTLKGTEANQTNPIVSGSYADPTVIRVGNMFYLYVTSARVRGYKSTDMIHWSSINTSKLSSANTSSSEVFTKRPYFTADDENDSGLGMWAPDINYFDGQYVMYYSISKWGGGSTCGIGVAVSDKPGGPFVSPATGNANGKLFVSSEIDVHNSIDPCFFEEDGKRYLFWGSFYGMYMTELTADGMNVKDLSKKTLVAGEAFEGAYVHKKGNFYYLFASVGACCEGMNSSYAVVVGRSENLAGPYLSKTGVDMKNYNTRFTPPTAYQPTIMKGDVLFAGPGHNSRIITDDHGVDWMFYHSYYNGSESRELVLDKIEWDIDGWPTLGSGTPSQILTEVPALNIRATNATDISKDGFTANWTAVAGATGYQLDVATDSAFAVFVAGYTNRSVSNTSEKISGLSAGTTYFYRIRSVNDAAVVSANSNTISLKTPKFLIVLLAGQSNMAGRGVYSQLAPADTVTYSNVLSLNKDSVWVRAKHPLHWDKSEAAVGMGITFAHELAEKLGNDVVIGLVPCAAGGTSISEWLSNAWFGNTGNYYLYTNLIDRAKKASESGEIMGMIWHQGEADAANGSHAAYQGRLNTFFTNVKNSLNMPDMPIVSGELGRYLSYSNLNQVNGIINGFTGTMPNYGVASSIGLTANPDNIHLTAASQIEFGKRYAAIFYAIYKKEIASPLASLSFSPGILSPAFHPDITEYTCYIPAGVDSITPHTVATYVGSKITGTEVVDVSSGSGVCSITATTFDGVTTKTYTVNFTVRDDVDYTDRVVNNDFDLAPDANCNPVTVVAGINGWDNSAWRPTKTSCVSKQFYGWTHDPSVLGTSTSQGINADGGSSKHGNWACWIGGNAGSASEETPIEFYQTIDKTALEAGTYKVQCLLAVGTTKKFNQRLFANNNAQYFGKSSDYLNNLVDTEKYTFAGYIDYGETNLKEMAVYVTIGENDSLKLGIRTSNKQSDGSTKVQQSPMFRIDYFRLTKLDPKNAADASLRDITLSLGDFDFLPETKTYHVVLPEGTTTVTTSATANIQDVTITGTGVVDVSSGSGVSTILVIALDGITQETYTINYTTVNTDIHEVNAVKKARCFVTDRRLTVKDADAYIVYNLSGIKIAEVSNNVVGASVYLTPGIYIVKTKEGEGLKVIVK